LFQRVRVPGRKQNHQRGRSFGLHGGPPDEYDAPTLTSQTLSAGAHMLGKILSVGVFGIDGYLVEAEFDVRGGFPAVVVAGKRHL
jgi:hypothetical protein